MSRTRTILAAASGAILVSCGALVGWVFHRTSVLVEVADEFLLAVKAQGTAGARPYLSEAFRASTSAEELEGFFTRSGLTRYRKASWPSRTFSLGGGRADLSGSVDLDDGRSLPLRLTLVEEGGGWKVYALAKPPPDPSEWTARDRLPTTEEQLALVRGSVHELAVARSTGDFARFRAALSPSWQASSTADGLREIYGKEGPLTVDLTALDPQAPAIVGEPTLADGILKIQVRYALEPEPLFVRGRYVYERGGWRLKGLYLGSTQKDG